MKLFPLPSAVCRFLSVRSGLLPVNQTGVRRRCLQEWGLPDENVRFHFAPCVCTINLTCPCL
jgi:hypothetical protein